MKTKFLLFGFIACLTFCNAIAQWGTNGGNIAHTNRNVGIGTNNPQQELHIIKNGSNADLRLQRRYSTQTDFFSGSNKAGIWSYGTKSLVFGTVAKEDMRINWLGNIGIGSTNPKSKLHLYGAGATSLRLQSSSGFGSTNIQFWSDPQGSTNEWRPAYIKSTDNGNFTGGLAFITNGTGSASKTGSVETMRLVNGRVGIKTTNPDAELTVRGRIHAQEVLVDLNGAVAPDYVFESNYHLRSLAVTEKYIQNNKHLPEIPSAAEMERNGVELKAMNLKLLQKIEELTLYIIEQDKRISKLESK
ncbi:tail fiber protein [Aquimarina sp. AU58]|uniref:tail fiber protein n=1 Tax=Aquimarina sp. AU58 TaxID=1874112 RepID=UPI000D651190|nr:tail fiber protein [Aquimarina sp. AU58]